MKRELMAAALVALAACGGREETTPTVGSSALVYLEGESLEVCGPSAVARGLVLYLTPAVLDAAQGALVTTSADLALEDGAGQPVPLEAVGERFRTRFERTGTYRLTAAFADGVQVTREIAVVEGVAVRLGARGRQLITHDVSGDCEQSVAEGPTPVLALNQELRAWIVPVDAQDRPLLGALELEFTGTGRAHKWMPTQPANSFLLRPTRAGTNVLSFTDTELRLEHQLVLEAHTATAVCPTP